MSGLGVAVDENTLIREIGTTEAGTDYVGLIERYLDRAVPHARYTSVYCENDPMTKPQKDKLWADLTGSINAGYGVVVNWVSPPGNRPKAVKGSGQPNYGWSTVWHYVAVMGWSDDRTVLVADPGFAPHVFWIPFDGPTGSLTSLIPPKGYCYAAATSPQPVSSRDRYAQAIIGEGRRERSGQGQLDHPVITDRGIRIALATALVESNLVMYANRGDPDSLNFPHEALSSDYNSTGLFQQRAPWWGTVADRMDPARSAALFYHALAKLDYNNNSRSPGSYAQQVQQSAFPGRYDEKFPQASDLFSQLTTTVGADDMAQVPQQQWDQVYSELTKRFPSRSPLRHLGEGLIDTATGIDLNIDGNLHVLLVKSLAELGDRQSLELLAEVASADPTQYPDRVHDANLARMILKDIETNHPAVIAAYLKGSSS